ncbi:methyltransferase domain-containing protein [Clostridium botulinum]|nr:methyltransferase domain-containing protein [Clostridium botulinum]
MKKEEVKGITEKYIQNGLIEEAEEIILQYKKVFGYDDEIASMESITNIYKNNLEGAFNCIREGLKCNIFNGDLYFNMGNIYEMQGECNRAYLCYEHALSYTDNKENKNIFLSAMKNLKLQYDIKVNNYSIIILTYNNLEYTKVCINSIRKYNLNNNYEIIIVDNNSTDGTVEWIKAQNDLKYILNKENKGFPAGCNQGISIAKENNDIFLLNNDTVIMANSIFNLRMGLYSDEKIGATGSVSNSVSYYQQINEQYDNFDEYINFSLNNNITDEKSYEQRVKLVGFAILIKRNVLDKVGLLDERFTPGNFEDDDISFRILKEGYKLLLCKDSYIQHFGSVSFKNKDIKYDELLNINNNKFKEKWGFYSKEIFSIRYDLIEKIDMIKLNKDKKINILDIGCGLGATLIKLRESIPSSNIYGLEKNKEISNVIQNLNILTDIQISNNVNFNDLVFDIIIFSKENIIDCDDILVNNIDKNTQIIKENEVENQDNIEFTGERLVINDFVREQYSDVMYEHLNRYKLASKYVKDRRVIDAASGTGYGTVILSKAGARSIKAFDISREAIDSAMCNYNQYKNIKFEIGDVTKLNVKNNSTDVFVSFETIEHIQHGKDLIKEASRVLEDDGIFIVSTPNRNATNPGLLFEEKPQNIYHSFEYSPLEFIGDLLTEFDIIELYGQTVNENIEFIKNKYMRQIFGKNEIDYLGSNDIKDYECRKISEFKNFEPMYLIAICKKKIKKKLFNEHELKEEVNTSNEGSVKFYKISNTSYLGERFNINDGDAVVIRDNVVIKDGCWLNICVPNENREVKIIINDGCSIGSRFSISVSNKCVIEKNVIIGPNVYIADCEHNYKNVEIPIMHQGITSTTNRVVVGENSWIGVNATIIGNVIIGKGCVIGANTFVNKDIPDYSVAVGSPAKIIKMFDSIDNEWKEVKSDKDIDKILKRREEAKYRVDFKELKSIQVEVSSICNLKCPQCFNNIKGHKSAILSKEIWNEKIRPILPQLTDIHLVGIGEPLLCKDFFNYAIECNKLGISVHTTSNLQLVNEEIAERIVTSGIKYLSFSCDGATEETYSKIRINGSLEKLISSVKLINKYKKDYNSAYPKLILNFGALNCNIDELPDVVHLAKKLQVSKVIAYHDIIYVKNLKQESLYYNQKKSDEIFNKAKEVAAEYGIEYFCPGTFTNPIKHINNTNQLYCNYPYMHLWIYSDGRVGPCCMDFPDRIILGDLKESTMEKIWNDNVVIELRKSLNKNPYKECLYCAQHGKMDLQNKKYLIKCNEK